MEGDIIDDETCAGWVLATSLDDITVNTYNEITKYALDGSAPSAVAHIKPGDAVLVQYTQDEEGAKTAYYLGRVRVEDEPMTREEVIEKYKNSMGDGEQQ